MIDSKTNTTYISNYTNDAELLNYYSGGDPRFNSLVTLTPTHKIESLYYIGDQKPLVEKMTYKDGEYDLEFEREFPNSVGLFRNDETRFTIGYLQNLIDKERKVKQRLLTKVYSKDYEKENNSDSFQQIYTYGAPYYVKRMDNQDKYTYVRNNSVIYGISELEQRENNHYLRGICFENTHGSLDRYFPFNMNADYYPTLKDENVSSAMIFSGFVDGSHHSIEIYKKGAEAVVDYTIKDHNETISEELIVPLLDNGNISNIEIKSIMTTLEVQFSKDSFISLILAELASFGTKIDIKNGKIEEDSDLLNPKNYINRSFGEIAELVNQNKDEFFDTISDQFKVATNINQTNQKVFEKMLNPVNS